MAPPAAAPAPLPPGTQVAGLVVEASGSITWQWVTFFVVGNVFAGFWLVLAFMNAYPEVVYHLKLLLTKLGLSGLLGGNKHAHSSQQSEQDRQEQQQQRQGPASAAASAPAGPASAGVAPVVPPLNPLASGPKGSVELGSPLRSHRSRPIPPPDLVVEQNITPRMSGTITTPQASVTPAAAAAPNMLSPRTEGSYYQTPSSTYHNAEILDDAANQGGGAVRGAAGGAVVAQEPTIAEEGSSVFPSDDTSLDAEPPLVKLEWRNLCYAVKSANGLRMIVQGVYGCANPQELQGLMGPSGAGKSTLMDLLSKRTDPVGANSNSSTGAGAGAGTVSSRGSTEQQRSSDPCSSEGETPSSSADAAVVNVQPVSTDAGVPVSVAAQQDSELLVNGGPLSRKAFMKISAYVPQHDNLVPTMTALEALSFYASIILPASTTQHTRRARIARVLAMMGLTKHSNTLVGGTLPGGILLRGLSGGERKRLAIACGVVAGPSLVFLDEPTSGLDSFAALNVVQFLKGMATQNGATLIASLHQPRSAIWGQLNQVTLLSSGRLMYTGPTDSLITWFGSLGYSYDPATDGMASDWALDLVSVGFSKPSHEAQRQQHEQQQQQGAGVRQRPVAAAAAAAAGTTAAAAGSSGFSSSASWSRSQPQQQQHLSMMTSKQELGNAADAFLLRLQELHPDWFPAGAAAGHKAAAARGDSFSYRHNGALNPIKVHRQQQGYESEVVRATGPDSSSNGVVADACGTVAELGDDTAASPFLQQTKQDAVQLEQQAQQQGCAQQLTDHKVLQQALAADHGLLQTVRTSWGRYKALLWREMLMTTRNPADVGGRMMTFTYVSLLSGLIAFNLPGGADSIMSRVSCAYAVLSFYLLMPFVFMSLFTSDKRFFAADTTARLYHPAEYYAAKVTVTLPFNVCIAVVFHLVYYGMIGMRHGSMYMAMSCLISVLMGITAMQAVYCCAIVASSQDLAFVYAIAWTALNLLVNPYMAMFNLYSLGWGFSWLRYLSPYNYAFQALVKVELSGRAFDCGQQSGLRVLGLIPDLLPATSSFAAVRNNINNLAAISTNRTCVASGDAVVDMYTTGLSFGESCGILCGYFLLFMGVTYLVVLRSSKRRGPSL